MTKKQFYKTVKIYSSHILICDRISISYSYYVDKNTLTVRKTIIVEKNGGALNSLFLYLSK